MRELTGHKVNGVNDGLQIVVADERGHGGAHHVYEIINVSKQNTAPDADELLCRLEFQNGPLAEGINGITHECLLAILMDRLEGFQSGPYACEENQWALEHLQAAQGFLKARTEKRLARGVEGTPTV